MRLIDADALKEKTIGHGEKIAYVVSFLWDVDASQTINAIPIGWLIDRANDTERAPLYRRYAQMLYEEWQKEQEART